MEETRLHEKINTLIDCVEQLHAGCMIMLQVNEVTSARVTLLEERVKQLENEKLIAMGNKH